MTAPANGRDTSDRSAGRIPGSGVVCPRGALCVSYSTSSLPSCLSTTFFDDGPEEGFGEGIAIDRRSCRNMERSRRCLLRHAEEPPSRPLMATASVPTKATQRRQHKSSARVQPPLPPPFGGSSTVSHGRPQVSFPLDHPRVRATNLNTRRLEVVVVGRVGGVAVGWGGGGRGGWVAGWVGGWGGGRRGGVSAHMPDAA